MGERQDKERVFHSRKYNRVPIEMEVEFQTDNDFVPGWSRDISPGGIYVKSGAPLKNGATTRIRFILDKEKEPVEVDCKVAWTNEGEIRKREADPRGMGIEFVDKDNNKRQVIREFVRDLTDLLRIMAVSNKRRDN